MTAPPAAHAGEPSKGGAWAFYALVVILLAMPLPFGAIYQWSWAGLAVLVALLLLASLPATLKRTRAVPSHQAALWLPALLYFSVVAWTMLQASNLPPDSWDHPVWQETAEALGESVTGTISLDPYASWSESLKLLTYAGVFWLAVALGRDRRRARVSLWMLGIAGCLYAVYGLAAFLSDLGTSLWLHRMPQFYAGVSSTFVNRNMYVDYAAFGLLAVLCLGLSARLSHRRAAAHWADALRGLLLGKDSYVLLLCTMGLVLLAALIMTGSRGGVIAAFVAVGGLLHLAVRRDGADRAHPRRILVAAAGLAALVAVVYALAGAHLGARFFETAPDTAAGRISGYRLLLRAIAEAPLTGYGAGNSLDVFYLFNDGAHWGAFNYAHNLYLGAAVELGVPAAVLLLAAGGLVAFHCYRGVARRARDQAIPALGVAATLLVAVHGLFDSPLYLAANAATYSFLMGLAYAHAWPTRANWTAQEPPGRSPRAHPAPREGQSE